MQEIQHIDRDSSLPRVETGPVQFGKDWPGVFIRGDNAFMFASALRDKLEGKSCILNDSVLRGLLSDLQSCILTR